MSWFFYALCGPVLWAASNHIDKFVISRYFSGKGVGSLTLFTAASGFIISAAIFIFKGSDINLSISNARIIAIAGALLVASYIPYLHALEHEEASSVTAIFQIIPVIGYLLGLVFLNEQLTLTQILASLLIIGGAVIISLDITHQIRFKAKPFWLMILSAFIIAINVLIFKIVALDSNFWGTAFWEYVGGGVFGLLLFTCVRLYREQFIATLRRSSSMVVSVSFASEVLSIIAKLFANFAALLAPIALVFVVNGLQPLIVFLYGVILTVFMPQWGKESLNRRVLIQKSIAIIIIFIGVSWLLQSQL